MPPHLQLVDAGPLPYLIAAPRAPARGPAPPLLCFLHGYDEGAPAPIQRALTLHGPLRPENAALIPDFVVVAPQLPTRGDLWHRFADAVSDVVDRVSAAHHVDPDRRFLTGFSFGGNGVFDLGLAQPGRWAALWAVDPTRVPPADPAAPVWLSLGELSRPRAAAFIERLRLRPAGRDGMPDRVYDDAGNDHVQTARSAYRDGRVYRWLLDQVEVSERAAGG